MRGRLVAALLITSAITLLVAAIALLNPLEKRLGHQEVRSILATATASRPSFEDLPLRTVRPRAPVLLRLARGLERHTGARVTLLDARGRVYVDTRSGPRVGTSEALASLATGGRELHPSGRLVAVANAADEARVTVPMEIENTPFVLALRKPLDNVTAAASDVRRAFTTAALAGLGIALLVGVVFAAYIARRLRRLRDVALDVAERGPAAPLPEVQGRDEVGDLARSFRRMQERLRELETARGQFLATASHELRTPVASLQGMLEIASQDLQAVPPDVDDARAQVEQAEAQSRRLGALAGDLLDLTRLDTGLDLREEPVEIGEVCRAVVAEFELRAAAAGRRLELRGADASVCASGDPGAVARIARILIDNALRHSPAGSAVVVEAVARPDGADLIVSDSGPGVDEDEREIIFERFTRGRGEEGGTGFGLGLAIGRALARGMGGELRLDHAGPSARFVLHLGLVPGRDLLRPREREPAAL
jgi:signal transduction histidine kinase